MPEYVYGPELVKAWERFASYIEIDNASGCWNWCGAKDRHGYGCFRFRSVLWRAHRFSYWIKYGVLTRGLEIDHLCRNPPCVNYEHLEEVNRSTNTLRGDFSWRSRRTHCKRGHAFDEENTYYYINAGGNDTRMCKACNKLRKRGEV